MIPYLLMITTMTLAVVYIFLNKESILMVQQIKICDIVLIVLFQLGFWVFTGSRLNLVMTHYGINLKTREWLGLTFITKFYSYFLPFRGGIAVRALYLRRIHMFEYEKFISSIMGLYAVNLLMNLLLAVVLFLFYLIDAKSSRLWHLELFATSGMILISAIILFVFYMGKKNILKERVQIIINSFYSFFNDTRLLCSLLINHLPLRTCHAMALYWSFKALGVEVRFNDIFILSIILAISLLFSITPGNLGVSEFIVIGSGTLFSYTLEDAIMAALLVRAIEIVIVLVLGIVSVKILSVNLTAKV